MYRCAIQKAPLYPVFIPLIELIEIRLCCIFIWDFADIFRNVRQLSHRDFQCIVFQSRRFQFLITVKHRIPGCEQGSRVSIRIYNIFLRNQCIFRIRQALDLINRCYQLIAIHVGAILCAGRHLACLFHHQLTNNRFIEHADHLEQSHIADCKRNLIAYLTVHIRLICLYRIRLFCRITVLEVQIIMITTRTHHLLERIGLIDFQTTDNLIVAMRRKNRGEGITILINQLQCSPIQFFFCIVIHHIDLQKNRVVLYVFRKFNDFSLIFLIRCIQGNLRLRGGISHRGLKLFNVIFSKW